MYNYLLISIVSDRLKIENQHREQVRAALAFTRKIKDFDDLVDPRRLFDYCLGPKPSDYVLEKIRREEKSKFVSIILFVILYDHPLLFFLLLTKMATRYSKEKYAHIKGIKNEPLSQLAIDSKK